jgi:hypothetical protein
MGYDVYITRKENACDQEGPSISLEEWLAFVAHDPEMRVDGYAEATVGDGETLRIESPGLSAWLKYSGHGKNGNMAWFYFDAGNISVKNPDAEILRKMGAIAQALSAKVQGDDGELYDSEGMEIPEASMDVGAQSGRRPWWKWW